MQLRKLAEEMSQRVMLLLHHCCTALAGRLRESKALSVNLINLDGVSQFRKTLAPQQG